ncbi:hypothetical protein HanIR_Chr12g0564921 [Helianthus annuus]|nr:hypothetical protein HanIR_Chr12g0564921 [Helianthus annuus]KAJ0503968.1 hypothetical protein HanHA89_Chr12g0454191 [Helianthus annuus]
MALCSMEAVKVIKKLGVRGLFTRELPLLIMMIGTLTGAQWGIIMLSMCLLGCCPHLCKKNCHLSPPLTFEAKVKFLTS